LDASMCDSITIIKTVENTCVPRRAKSLAVMFAVSQTIRCVNVTPVPGS
jgi:hypothetical protein